MSYKKYYLYKEQISYDGGTTWQDVTPSVTTPSGDPIGTYETYEQCTGGTPTIDGKFKLTLSDLSTVSAECDATSAITQSEVSSQYSGSVVSAVIGDCVTSIGDEAFDSCTSLTTIYIPSGVTSIGDGAFANCDSLTSVTVNATTPPTLGGFAFVNTNNCPIYVPAGSVNAYIFDTRWSEYSSRIQAIP